MGIVSQKKKGVPSYTPCPEPAMLLWSCGWFCHEGFLKGKPSLSVYIYIWIGDIYKTIIDRKVVYVCLCLCKVWTIIICLPLFNIFSLYHSIKKDRNQTYHHFMKQEEIKRLHSNVYLYIYIIYIHNTHIYIHHTFFVAPWACLTKCQAVLCSFAAQELGFVMGNHTLSLSPEDITFWPQWSGKMAGNSVIIW